MWGVGGRLGGRAGGLPGGRFRRGQRHAGQRVRVEQGYPIFNFGLGNGGLTAANAAARRAVLALGARR